MELTLELKSSLIHAFVGLIIGYVSSTLTSNFVVLFMAAVILFATGQVSERVLKLKDHVTEKQLYDKKWWAGNGVYPYVAFWIFIWILFYNL